MNIKQAYNAYFIPPNLQEHMLRVAALSLILSEKWNADLLDTESIVYACLFHDMANIIKYDFDKSKLFKENETQIDYWKQVQTNTIKKYGANIHRATFQISKEIGLPTSVLNLIQNLQWNNTKKVLKNHDYNAAISIYCDMRIGPFGILSLHDRIKNLQTRNNANNFNLIYTYANKLENTLQKHMLIDVNSISDIQLNNKFDELLRREV